MKFCQLMLADAKWTAVNSDKTTTENYNEVNRDKLQSFELKYKKKIFFIIPSSSVIKLDTKGKTLLHRLKTIAKSNQTTMTIHNRVRIIALLQRNKNPAKNKHYNNYSFDPDLSEIHYIFEDGTIQKRNDFGDRSPYLPLELIPEELEHLMMKGTT